MSDLRSELQTRTSTKGGALVMVLLIVCVLSVVASSMLLTTTMRYHTTFQSASWQEAIVGSEAGVDLAMSELRKRVTGGPSSAFKAADPRGGAAAYWTVTGPGGATYPNYGHAFPANNRPYVLATHGNEGNQTLQARVYVDVPGSDTLPTSDNFAVIPDDAINSFISQFDNPNLRDPDGVDRSRWWFRIRSLGIASVSGPPRPNLEKLDNGLRHFSLFNDWRTGESVATPQVARMVEVVVQPQMNFRNALMADKRIDLSNQDVLIDSYDSSKGYYDPTLNHGTMGNIATNGQLINASHAQVYGDAMTNNGTVNDGDKVTGQQSASFYQELTPFTAGLLNPAWNGVADGGTITDNATFTASVSADTPTLVRLDGIDLPRGGKVVKIAAPPPPNGSTDYTPSYIKIYVQGDINTVGNSYINVDPSVSAIIYFTGNVNLQGNGIINNSFLGRQLVLNGIQPPASGDGTYPSRSINIATTQDFEGIVYAPNHDLTLALRAAALTDSLQNGPMTSQQIAALQQQIATARQNIAALQADYNSEMDAYHSDDNNGHGNGNGNGHNKGNNNSHYKKAQQDLARINNLNAQVAGWLASLQQLLAINPNSANDDHARGYNGIYGGFVAKTITVANKTHLHYDETLRNAGPVNHYEIVNWFEDNASRGAVGGASAFWWAGAK